MKFSKNLLFLFLLFGNIIFISLFVSAEYSETFRYSPAYNNIGGAGLFYGGSSLKIDDSVCQQGTDFIVQISPLSCEPTVVTSDLLAEENVNVFCKMTATKINPLIDVTDINSIRFAEKYPREVVNIGYMPAQSALGYTQSNLDGSLLLDNMGYVVITLRKQPNESALTNCQKTVFGTEVCWIKGSLTATFNYDVKNSFGVGNSLFYLPLLNEEEWNENYVRYSFWDGRGYLRAEDIDGESASISVYSDNTVLKGILSEERRYALQKYSSNINLKVGGEESSKIYLPGLSPCLASLQLKLEGVEDPDTFVRIKVNEDYLELRDEESFLDGRCSIKNIDLKGISQNVEIKCKEDDKSADSFYLRILPKVNLEVNGEVDSYEVGEYLYQADDGEKFVYLGYVGVAGNEIVIDNPDVNSRLYVYLVALPEHKDSLSYDEITSVARHAESIKSSSGDTGKLSKILEGTNKWITTSALYAGKHIIRGEDFKFIPFKDSKLDFASLNYEFKGGTVALEGLTKSDNTDSLDEGSNWEYANYYEKATDSFDTVINSYTYEVPDSKSLQEYGELALIEKINLAYSINQKETMMELCKQFVEDYPDSIHSPEICINPLKISNSRNSVKRVIINGKVKDISFEGISSPSVSEYSARVMVTDADGKSEVFDLRKDRVVSLANFRTEKELKELKVSEYIILEELDGDSAKIKISVDNHGRNKEILVDSKTFKKGVSSEKYGDYTFTLTDIKLEKVAKVSVIANIDLAKSNSTFNFTIGVEKRAIQLSPEKAAEKIEKINKSIEEWSKVSKAFGGVVSVWKGACIATEAGLVIKNLIANRNGKAIARQEVMAGEGGWNKICEQEMKNYPTRYSSLNSCFLAHSEQIENDVNGLSNIINRQNQIINGISSEGSVEFIGEFSESVEESLNSLSSSQAEEIPGLNKLKEILNDDYLLQKGYYTLDELKEIQLYALYLKSTPANSNDEFRKTALERLNSVISDVNKNSEAYFDLKQKSGSLSINPDYVFLADSEKKKDKQQIYQGETLQKIGLELNNLKPTNPVATTQLDGKVYILILDGEIDSKYYPVKKTFKIIADEFGKDTTLDVHWIYDSDGNFVMDENVINKLKDYTFQKIDAASFKNPYQYSYGSSDILLKYSGTYAYRNKPVVVPFDKQEGWYAGIKSPGTAYDASGVIREFWLCNVGEDGIEEFQLEDFGGDYCLLVNTAQANEANIFSSSVNVKQKIKEAIEAISIAQKRYKEGVKEVYIPGFGNIKVGEPLTESPKGECTDFMSVEDCILLFNACDPVVCPSSRCDFGGKYPVTDVTATGIVGSLFLCYPNAKWEGGDIYVPFCLSGINAGIENWISVKRSYADCLQKGIDTGETVGICDEIHSIYLCKFFWEQAIPVVKLMGPKIIDKVLGKNSRGGGEYQTFSAALKNAQNSIDYFTQFYAEDSYRAFKVRSTDEIGGSICGGFASVVYPDSGSFLSNLIAPDSPFQFTGKFEESQITTATNPPTSHYKVYFHIYAGTDSGAYYSVNLKGSGSSYYQDTAANRNVDSGYIAKGESADETIDFTAPSGYNTLCITVNGREECGFKEVSSSFAINYLSDLYVEAQATKTEIKTKEDCTTGSTSIYSALDLNVISAANNLRNPELYSQGIIRTCATESPGKGTDSSVGTENERWKKVGYCDDKNIGCWIDTESVKDALKFLDIEENTVSEIKDNAQKSLTETYYSIEEFNAKKTEIKAESNLTKRLELIKGLLNSGKVFFSGHKAYLYFETGKIYSSLTLSAYDEYVKAIEEARKKKEQEESGAGLTEDEIRQKIVSVARSLSGTTFLRITSLTENEQKEIDKTKSIWTWNTIPVIQDYDSSGNVINCFDSVLHAYKMAGIAFNGFAYCLHDDLVDVDNDGCNKNTDIMKDDLQEGDILSLRYGSSNPQPHSVIFLAWVDKDSGKAEIFDWLGEGVKFRVVTVTLKFDEKSEENTVYAVGKPVIAGKTTEPRTEEGATMGTVYVIEESRLLGLRGRNIYFKYQGGEWTWSMGDIYNWQDASETEVSGGEYDGKSPEKTTREVLEKLDRLSSDVYERGVEIIVAAGGENTGILSISKDTPNEDNEGSTSSESYISPIFEFQDGTNTQNTCYKYFGSGWHWMITRNIGTLIKRTCNDEGREEYWMDLNVFIDGRGRVPDGEGETRNVDFIKSLEGKSYLEGLELLMGRTTADEEGGISNPELITYEGTTTFSSKNIFKVDLDAESDKQFYKYFEKEGWKWSFMDDFWTPTTTYVPTSGPYTKRETPQVHKDLMYSINGVDFLPGAAILFDPNSNEVRNAFRKTSSEGDTSLETNFQKRDLTKLTNLMKSLSTSVSASNYKCYCGENCGDYAKWITSASSSVANNIPDELLLLAIMIQESSCKSVKSSGGDIGLMQINARVHCGTKGLEGISGNCNSTLLSNNELNIYIGAQILREAYSSSSRVYTCLSPAETYSGWEYALRGYNGWGCTGDSNYVENVKEKYFELVELYNGMSASTGGTSGETETTNSGTTTLAGNRADIINEARDLSGIPFIKYDQLSTSQRAEIDKSQDIWTWKGIQIVRDYDNSGSVYPNCFDSVLHLYKSSGVAFSSFVYCLEDGKVDTDSDGCEKNTDINKDSIEQGDILSIRYYGENHNVVFLRWIDKNSGRAEVFDWIGRADESKFPSDWAGLNRAFRSFEVILKFDESSVDYTVYAIGKPAL